MPRFRADEEQIRHVAARDQQHDADRAEKNPQDGARVADHVIGERPDIRLQLQSR
jgi:hypothetical protein